MNQDRIQAVRERLRDSAADALLSVSPPDNQYVSGFTTSFEEISSAVLVTDTHAILLTDSRYTEQAREEASAFEVEQVSGDLLERAGERLKALGVKCAAVDPGGIKVDEFERAATTFGGEFKKVSGLLSPLRVQKSKEEVERIRAASNLAEGVLIEVSSDLEGGVSEREVAARIEFEFKKRGAEGASFGTIALFGARGSLPHGVPGDRALKRGDSVLFDLGCRRRGYCSDLTRTYAFGSMPGPWFEEIYALTLAAQRAAVASVRPGIPCKQVDNAARAIIADGGFGDAFGHGVGHGVGIEIHEAPRVNPRSDAVLAEGMVITIEPGIYLPGQGGVRIEDLVVVTADGCDVLTTSSKELKVLD